jgi:hypothetical protein
VLHKMGDLKTDEPLRGFLLALVRRKQGEIFEEPLEVDIWRTKAPCTPVRNAFSAYSLKRSWKTFSKPMARMPRILMRVCGIISKVAS